MNLGLTNEPVPGKLSPNCAKPPASDNLNHHKLPLTSHNPRPSQGLAAIMVYRWEQHRLTCYRLYVEENRTIQEVVDYMRVHHDFTPR